MSMTFMACNKTTSKNSISSVNKEPSKEVVVESEILDKNVTPERKISYEEVVVVVPISIPTPVVTPIPISALPSP
jgi:hypothetical protein